MLYAIIKKADIYISSTSVVINQIHKPFVALCIKTLLEILIIVSFSYLASRIELALWLSVTILSVLLFLILTIRLFPATRLSHSYSNLKVVRFKTIIGNRFSSRCLFFLVKVEFETKEGEVSSVVMLSGTEELSKIRVGLVKKDVRVELSV